MLVKFNSYYSTTLWFCFYYFYFNLTSTWCAFYIHQFLAVFSPLWQPSDLSSNLPIQSFLRTWFLDRLLVPLISSVNLRPSFVGFDLIAVVYNLLLLWACDIFLKWDWSYNFFPLMATIYPKTRTRLVFDRLWVRFPWAWVDGIFVWAGLKCFAYGKTQASFNKKLHIL